ncbi:helix-turn-helix transcriptional regulator [Listeria booriae]|uniref:Helix-turn-helix transcriptional regulator n=1 Tax=Listeria booriae TaxID=1552123 RepID=A0A842E436_9LIST|nr:helix-turn-helix transcriptional regulator [Listeria booriae]MBC1373389.1 helix-turn-helix transcriptional regulator [Listeria booriae]MBC2066994.1 helix-turn-helix transcriptional regulator [Listeria booriae]
MTLDLLRLKAERVARGLTQDELAARLGWKRPKYAKRENGIVAIGADELALIVDALGLEKKEMYIFFTHDVDKRERKITA